MGARDLKSLLGQLEVGVVSDPDKVFLARGNQVARLEMPNWKSLAQLVNDSAHKQELLKIFSVKELGDVQAAANSVDVDPQAVLEQIRSLVKTIRDRDENNPHDKTLAGVEVIDTERAALQADDGVWLAELVENYLAHLEGEEVPLEGMLSLARRYQRLNDGVYHRTMTSEEAMVEMLKVGDALSKALIAQGRKGAMLWSYAVTTHQTYTSSSYETEGISMEQRLNEAEARLIRLSKDVLDYLGKEYE